MVAPIRAACEHLPQQQGAASAVPVTAADAVCWSVHRVAVVDSEAKVSSRFNTLIHGEAHLYDVPHPTTCCLDRWSPSKSIKTKKLRTVPKADLGRFRIPIVFKYFRFKQLRPSCCSLWSLVEFGGNRQLQI